MTADCTSLAVAAPEPDADRAVAENILSDIVDLLHKAEEDLPSFAAAAHAFQVPFAFDVDNVSAANAVANRTYSVVKVAQPRSMASLFPDSSSDQVVD